MIRPTSRACLSLPAAASRSAMAERRADACLQLQPLRPARRRRMESARDLKGLTTAELRDARRALLSSRHRSKTGTWLPAIDAELGRRGAHSAPAPPPHEVPLDTRVRLA